MVLTTAPPLPFSLLSLARVPNGTQPKQKEQPVRQAMWDLDMLMTENSFGFAERLEALEGGFYDYDYSLTHSIMGQVFGSNQREYNKCYTF